MTQWTNINANTGAPKFTVDATTGQTGTQQFGNTVFGIRAANNEPGAASPGWVRKVSGKGVPVSVRVVNGGTGYANTNTVAVPGSANGTVVTNASGVITSVNINLSKTPVTTAPTATVTTSTGNGAVLQVVLGGGHADRVFVETLVAMRGIRNA
jgi:hypothetical protein